MGSRISHIEIFKYRIPLSYPLTTCQSYYRYGIILILYDSSGNCGAGEIAPLEGLSKETLNDSLKQVISVLDKIKGSDICSFDLKALFPSVKLGIESAALTLKANQEGIPLWKLLNPKKKEDIKIRITALISSESKKEISGLINNGYTSFKLKVKGIKDAELVGNLRQIAGEKVDIIIDANKRFSFEEGIIFGKMIYPYNISYIEDPLNDAFQLKDFFKKTGIAIGIDQDINRKQIRYGEHIKAWIIKPGIVGGLKESILLIKEALRNNIIPVLSNPFYSGVGVAMLVLLASSFIPENISMGFDPYRWIKEDVLEEPFVIKNGGFLLKDVLNKMEKIKKSRMQRVL